MSSRVIKGLRPMGRKRSVNHDLPPGVQRKGKSYYLQINSKPRRWIPLGNDINKARTKWAELMNDRNVIGGTLFRDAVQRYRAEILIDLAPKTQREYSRQLDTLDRVFGAVDCSLIEPRHVYQFLQGMQASHGKVTANRHRSVLSTVYNHARFWGMTSAANPCQGVRGFTEKARDRYIEDHEYQALREVADSTLRDCLDITYLTGQRPADVLKMRRSDIVNGYLRVRQNKTDEYLQIAIVGELAAALDRTLNRPRSTTPLHLIADDDGRPIRKDALRYRFDRAREKTGVDCQFRDFRAKAASDAETEEAAKALLGHRNITTTQRYIRSRSGTKVKPVK